MSAPPTVVLTNRYGRNEGVAVEVSIRQAKKQVGLNRCTIGIMAERIGVKVRAVGSLPLDRIARDRTCHRTTR